MASSFYLQKMQEEVDNLDGYMKQIKKIDNINTKDSRNIFILILIMTFIYLLIIVSTTYEENIKNTVLILYIIIWVFSLFVNSKKEGKLKKSFKFANFANKARIQFIINIMLNLILVCIIIYIHITFYNGEILYLPFILFIYTLIYFFQPYLIYLSDIIAGPLELLINRYYYIKAQKKIRSFDKLQIVGITGSFEKNSIIFIATTILKHKYRVLNTAESHSTFMDISKTINEKLNEKHQIFIVGMDTKNIGDIKKLSSLVKPNIGVITSIEKTNLEAFKNIDNIMKAKYEIVEVLPADGLAIFNYDNEYIKKLADKTFKEKILYGLKENEKLDIYVDDIEIVKEKINFTIKDKDGYSIKCSTKILEKKDLYNLLAGVSIAYALGLNFNEIKKGISKIESICVEA